MSCLPTGNGSAGKKQKLSRPGSPNEQLNQLNNHYSSASTYMSNHLPNGVPNSSAHYVNGYAHSNHMDSHLKCNGVGKIEPCSSNGHIPQSTGQHASHLLSHNRVPTNHVSAHVHNNSHMSHDVRSQGGSNQKHLVQDCPLGNNVSSYEMCSFCFDLLINRLKPEDVPRVAPPNFSYSNDSFPLFVTWECQKADGKMVLRGCIGTFTETKLHKGLHDYALSSALKDSRFNPISADEIPHLRVSVSILLNFEAAESWEDWVIGVHGLRLELETDRGQKKTATYLPEVASEQGWTKKQTIDSLLQKSGYSGRINSELRSRIKLTRYKSEKVSMFYSEYRSRQRHLVRATSGGACEYTNGGIVGADSNHVPSGSGGSHRSSSGGYHRHGSSSSIN